MKVVALRLSRRSGLAPYAIVLILVIVIAAAGASAYFLLAPNQGGNKSSSTTTTVASGYTTTSATSESTLETSTSTLPTTAVSTSSQAAASYGSVASTLILYNNTLESGLPDISTSTFQGNYSTVSIFDMIYDPGNGYLYGSGFYSNASSSTPIPENVLMVINPNTNKVIDMIQLSSQAPDQMAYDSANGYIYGTDSHSINITVFDANTNTVLPILSVAGSDCATIQFTCNEFTGIAYDANSNLVYANFCCGDRTLAYPPSVLTTINPVTGSISTSLTLYAYNVWGHVFYDTSNQLLYVTSSTNPGTYGGAFGNLTVINPSTSQILKTIQVGYPSGPETFAFDPATSDIFVACEGNVSVISSTTDAVVGTINLPQSMSFTYPPMIGSIAFDPQNGFLYATGGTSPTFGALAIDPTTDSIAGVITTNVPTYAIAFAPSSGEVYMGDFSFGVIDIVS